jgi:hypothetical protein
MSYQKLNETTLFKKKRFSPVYLLNMINDFRKRNVKIVANANGTT